MSETILTVKDLSVTFGHDEGAVEAVKGVSFDVKKGESIALVGESGSGKSVTALSILQLLPYPKAHHPSGSITWQGEEMVNAKPRRLRQIRGDQISMIFQEPLTSLNPLHSIEKQISEVLFIHKAMGKKQARERCIELLKLVGMEDATTPERLAAFPHEFSGGQRQRIMIAMALANEPDVLIADEPTTALDVTVQAQILKLLKELQDKMGMALILITHDLGIVRHTTERVCVMSQGEIVEAGDTKTVFDHPQHDYTKQLLAAEPKGRPEVDSSLEATELVAAKNLKVWYPIKKGIIRRVAGHVKAVDGISLSVKQGRTLGVVGESGSGKSTLGRALIRLETAEGDIRFDGRNLQGMTRKDLRPLRADMQMVFQDPFGSLSPRLSVGQIVEEGLVVHGMGGSFEERREIVSKALEEVGLQGHMQDRYPHEFSGGQRQRIAIARALALKPKFIVLDEPTSALDVSVQAQITELLRDLQVRYDLAYLFISHDLKVVRALAHDVIVMRRGRVVEQGPSEQIFASPQEDYTRALMAAAFDMQADESGVVGV